MQSLRSLLVPTVLTTAVWLLPGLAAQEPEQPPAGGEPTPATAPEASEQAPEARQGRGRQGRQRRGLVVIEAGTVHPVSGPPIENGVVVIRGDRILAVGKQGDLGLPEGTVVRSFPTGHVYPGLIDAATDAFTDPIVQADRALDGSTALADGLVWRNDRDDHLVQSGVTTAYVTVRSGARVRGQGALVRPRADGFELWQGKEQAALQLRMTDGMGPSHPLQRQQQLASVAQLFEGLEDYRKAKEKFGEELTKYEDEFAKYLAFHREKSGKKEGAAEGEKPPEGTPTEAPAQPGEDPAGRRRPAGAGPRRGGRPPQEDPPTPGGGLRAEPSAEAVERALTTLLAAMAAEDTSSKEVASPQDPQPQGRSRGQGPGGQGGRSGAPTQGAAAGQGAPAASEGPKRPTYPKKPTDDPQRDALLRVLDGELPLRVEAHRPDELRSALHLQREHKVPLLVLEQAYGAAGLTQEIARQGASVVLTELLPFSLSRADDLDNPYRSFDPAALAAKLEAAGVPFAIAGGRARLSSMLPMLAAAAVGAGLSEEAALRAVTLTPAEILGVAAETGSLARGKYADVLVTDGPLFATDSRVLMVVARGRTEFEAK